MNIVPREVILREIAAAMIFDCELGMKGAIQLVADKHCLDVEAVRECVDEEIAAC